MASLKFASADRVPKCRDPCEQTAPGILTIVLVPDTQSLGYGLRYPSGSDSEPSVDTMMSGCNMSECSLASVVVISVA